MGGTRRKQEEAHLLEESSVKGKQAKIESGLTGEDEDDAANLPSRSDTADDAALTVANLERKEKCSDAEHLLQIFPEEVWRLIFDSTSDPAILENLSLASPFFSQLLLPKRVIYLFPKVWEILGVKYETELDAAYMDYKMTSQDLRANHLRDWMSEGRNEAEVVKATRKADVPWFRTIQKFRLVCKAWGDAVDGFYGNHPRHYKMKDDLEKWKLSEGPKRESGNDDNEEEDYSEDDDGIGSWAEVNFSQQDAENLEEFSTHFEHTHGTGVAAARSPFISRTVTFESAEGATPAEAQRFRNQISTFLLKYGRHIWNVILDIRDQFSSWTTYYSKLREWMELMPNLKVLDIRYYRVNSWHRVRGFRREYVSWLPDELSSLEKEIKLHPLPKIESLVCIKTTGLRSPIFNQLVRQNCHVSILEVQSGADEKNYDIYSFPMTNLSQLAIRIKTTENVGRLGTLPVNWPLNKLYVSFLSCHPFVEWPIIFSLLQDKWAESLTNLVIILPNVPEELSQQRIAREYSTLRLELPKVTRLKLGINNYTSLDFILPMKHELEVLEISLNMWDCMRLRNSARVTDAFDAAQVIRDVLVWREEMSHSNIWTLFPKLKLIYYNGLQDWVTRTEWEKAVKKKERELEFMRMRSE